MKITLSIPLFISALAAPMLFGATDILSIPREDGSSIEVYYSHPDGAGASSLVVAIESWDLTSTSALHQEYASTLTSQGLSLVSLQKRGISTSENDLDMARQHNNFQESIADHTTLLQWAHDCGYDRQGVILCGFHDGGKIAPQIALHPPGGVCGVALMGSGGGLPYMDELRYYYQNLQQQESQQQGISSRLLQYVTSFWKQDPFEEFLALCRNPSHPDAVCALFDARTIGGWAACSAYDPLPDLLTLDLPIFMAHASQDRYIPVASSEAVARAFAQNGHTNLEYIPLEQQQAAQEFPSALVQWAHRIFAESLQARSSPTYASIAAEAAPAEAEVATTAPAEAEVATTAPAEAEAATLSSTETSAVVDCSVEPIQTDSPAPAIDLVETSPTLA